MHRAGRPRRTAHTCSIATLISLPPNISKSGDQLRLYILACDALGKPVSGVELLYTRFARPGVGAGSCDEHFPGLVPDVNVGGLTG